MSRFEAINKGYDSVFNTGELSFGLVVPIEYYPVGSSPTMRKGLANAQLAEKLGFKALWLRDIPLNVPSFGDVGQTYDPFAYLGYLAGQTSEIALGISSIALPLHHPVHVAKSAATIDQLSDGRMILGVASGDRPDEYPGLGIDFEHRGALFRESFAYIRAAQEHFPALNTEHYGILNGSVDVLPKASAHKIPMLLTGHSQQSLAWNAEHGDGWMYYLRHPKMQTHIISDWREQVYKHSNYDKPFMTAMYLALHPDPDFAPQPIQLGYHTGVNFLEAYLHVLKDIGVNHVAFNLRFNTMGMENTLELLSERILPHFHQSTLNEA